MIPVNPHTINVSLLALPAAVALTRKLLRDRKALAPSEAIPSADQIEEVERRANTMSETLKNIVGYPHHGLNE
jgi:hypothetical protein